MGPSQRSLMARSIARAVRGASGTTARLPPFRMMASVRWPRSVPRVDVGAGGFGDPEPVQGEQRDEGVLGWGAEPGGDPYMTQERAGFIAGPVRWRATHSPAGTADVHGRGVVEEFFFDGVLAEPGDGAQPAGDRGAGSPCGLEAAAEAFDVSAADREQVQLVAVAPGG
jgi:hypothetical protein